MKRNFVVKCRANRGGKHLVPVSVMETVAPSDPLMDYDVVRESPYFGSIREQLEKRGDLLKTANGEDRITRTPHIGKSVHAGRNGFVFVHFSNLEVPEFVLFTKRTNNPKLAWLLRQCQQKGLRVKVVGRSAHAPVTHVHRDDELKAWEILEPVDYIPDNDPRFRTTKMSEEKSFKKTVIRVEVISEGDWEWESLADVAHAITSGGCSGVTEVDAVAFLSEEETALALIAQGSDPAFLLGSEWEGWQPEESNGTR